MHQRIGIGPDNKYTCVGFDLDNTLLYSENLNKWATRKTTADWGFKYSRMEKQDLVGLTNKALFYGILRRQDSYKRLTPERQTQIVNGMIGMKRQFFNDRIDLATPVAGAVEIVMALHQLSIPLAIATVAGKRSLGISLKRLGLSEEMFNILIPSDALPAGYLPKPDPRHWAYTAGLLCQDLSKVLVVEDSLKGIASARGAGLDTVALSTTASREELIGAGVLEVFKDHFELAKWLGVEIEKGEE
ncbi:MAG TPA: HAD family phosphatase [Candidatus Paceibacterota bacterium]